MQLGPGEDPVRLDEFLRARLPVSRKRAKRMLDERRVFVNGRRVWMARHRLTSGDTVQITGPAERETGTAAPHILFEDGQFVAVDKPPGILSNGRGSIEEQIRILRRNREIRAVHRLDRDTSGCLLLAKGESARRAMVAVFTDRAVRKAYHALAVGHVRGPVRSVGIPVDGKSARSSFRVLDSNSKASHLLVHIATGRTHQIRRHLAALHHPVLGDWRYATGRHDQPAMSVPRQMLHASRLVFGQPISGKRITISAPLPPDFRSCLRTFRLR